MALSLRRHPSWHSVALNTNWNLRSGHEKGKGGEEKKAKGREEEGKEMGGEGKGRERRMGWDGVDR